MPDHNYQVGDRVRYVRTDGAWPVGTLGVVTEVDNRERMRYSPDERIRVQCEIPDGSGRNNLYCRLTSIEHVYRMPTQEETAALMDTIKELTDDHYS